MIDARLTARFPTGPVASYAYDALGRRIAKTLGTSGSPNEYFYYDGHRVNEHHTDAGGTMQLHKQYVYGLNYIDEPVAYYEANASGVATDTPHFILRDANYDVVAITNQAGGLEQQMTYDPYGNYVYIENGTGAPYSGTDADVSALLIPLGRNGLWYDPETGLYYVRARYYDPALGRWRERDPNETGLALLDSPTMLGSAAEVGLPVSATAQFGDGMDLYGYADCSPANSRDPMGLYEIDVHYYMTYWLARLIPCFSESEARAIAEGDQGTDENKRTAPGPNRPEQNARYHHLHDNNPEGSCGYLNELWADATFGPVWVDENTGRIFSTRKPLYMWGLKEVRQRRCSLSALGLFMHHLQDSYSHAGYTSQKFGHLRGGYAPDAAHKNVPKALRMAQHTWNALAQWTQQCRPDCYMRSVNGRGIYSRKVQATLRGFFLVNDARILDSTLNEKALMAKLRVLGLSVRR